MVYLFYTTYISVDLAHYEIFHAKVGKSGISGDNPRALVSGLSYAQVDKHGITILYHLHQCRPCTSSDISC